jgi:hypothetical protein
MTAHASTLHQTLNARRDCGDVTFVVQELMQEFMQESVREPVQEHDFSHTHHTQTPEAADYSAGDYTGDYAGHYADYIARQAGFSNFIEWHPIRYERARLLVLSVLYADLVYGSVLMEAETAEDLTNAIFAAFGEAAQFFTNGVFHETVHASGQHILKMDRWMPLTHSAFDTGIVAVLPPRVGIFWVQDEQ